MTVRRVLQSDATQVGRTWQYRETPDTRGLSVVSYETQWSDGVQRAELVGDILRRVARDLERTWGHVGSAVVVRDLRDRPDYRTRPPRPMRQFLPLGITAALTEWREAVRVPGIDGLGAYGVGTLDWRRVDARAVGEWMLDGNAIGLYFFPPGRAFEADRLLSLISGDGSTSTSELLTPLRSIVGAGAVLATAWGEFDDEIQAVDLLCAPAIAAEVASGPQPTVMQTGD